MKISVVTISFNQAEFLQDCIDSIAAQEGEFEHIIVDPGSTDGSRDIIEANKKKFSHIILEKDEGPADGLNHGFSRATGEICYYLNSDDIVFPDAFKEARYLFYQSPKIDVISGNGYIIDENGIRKKKIWSDPVTRFGLSHSSSIVIQPSTFIKKEIFKKVGGFNIHNKSCWDAELIREMFLKGARFKITNKFWAGYRLYEDSITGSGRLNDLVKTYNIETYEKLIGRKPGKFTKTIQTLYRIKRIIRHPGRLTRV